MNEGASLEKEEKKAGSEKPLPTLIKELRLVLYNK
jgi:hypothetical protein